MTTQVLLFNVFSEKDPHLNALELFLFWQLSWSTSPWSVLVSLIRRFPPSQMSQQVDIATTQELIHTLIQWLNGSMTYLICETVEQAKKPSGQYQRFTCGFGKRERPPYIVTTGKKRHSSWSKWEAGFWKTIWNVALVWSTLFHSVH